MAEPDPLTLGRLFEIYGDDVTPTKGQRSRKRDKVATAMFLRFLGEGRDPATLSQWDWDRFIRARRTGRAGLSGKPVGDRMIEGDLTFLMAVLNWTAEVDPAVSSGDRNGLGEDLSVCLPTSDPIRDLKPVRFVQPPVLPPSAHRIPPGNLNSRCQDVAFTG